MLVPTAPSIYTRYDKGRWLGWNLPVRGSWKFHDALAEDARIGSAFE